MLKPWLDSQVVLGPNYFELRRKFNGASLDAQPFTVLYERYKWAIRNRIRTLELNDIYVIFVISLDAYYFLCGIRATEARCWIMIMFRN